MLSRRNKRGNVLVIFALALVVILGFGALAIDVGYMRLAQAQTQDVADAASQAALFQLRRTGDMNLATQAAESVARLNVVAGKPPDIESITFGQWDEDSGTFVEDNQRPNGVSVTASRADGNAVGLFLGRFYNWDEVNVRARATSAARNLHACIAMDITNSWSRPNYYYAREAAVTFYDTLANAYSDSDKIGMTVFTGRYAWEFTPLTLMTDDVTSGYEIRDQWEAMETASKAGKAANNGSGCSVYSGSKTDNFKKPSGGCFPDMPREYRDEPGTDHTTGMAMCQLMFQAETDVTAYRAMVVLTDGYPNGIGKNHGKTRIAQGYTETRWDEYQGPIPHTTNQVKADSVTLAQEMYEQDRVHTWVVSFVADDAFMENMVNGDGYYVNTKSAAALVPIFEDIANSLPMAIVE